MNYLAACPALGRSYLRTLIQSQPLTSDMQALKLAHICDRFALKPEKDAIYHQMGMAGNNCLLCAAATHYSSLLSPAHSLFAIGWCVFAALRAGRYGAAVHWFVLCKATTRLTYICDTLLQRLIDARRAPPLSAASTTHSKSNANSTMSDSDEPAPLSAPSAVASQLQAAVAAQTEYALPLSFGVVWCGVVM